MGNIEMKKIITSLAVNPPITLLSLKNNTLDDNIQHEIFKACKNNTVLQHLDMRGIPINEQHTDLWLDFYSQSLNLIDLKLDTVEDDRLDLKELNNRGISVFPDNLLLMENITSLDISYNSLLYIPKEIANLRMLAELDCSYNKLLTLPTSLGYSQSLRLLNAEGNPLISPPPDKMNKSLKTILKYLRDCSEDSRSLNTVNLLVLGDEQTGKTSIIKSLQKRMRYKKELLNDVIKVVDYSYDIPEFISQEKKSVIFRTFDFEREEIYRLSHKFYITPQSVVIIAWDLRKSENESHLDFWLQSVCSCSETIKVILVGTHVDEFVDDLEQAMEILLDLNSKYKKRFPQIDDIIAVDSVFGDLENLILKIGSCASQLNHVKETVSRNVDQLLALIKDLKFSVISWEEIQNIGYCAAIGEEEELKHAIKVLSNERSIIHLDYPESGIQNMVIADLLFIPNIISKFLNVDRDLLGNGLLNLEDFPYIWPDSTTESASYSDILKLLFYMKVLYPLQDVDFPVQSFSLCETIKEEHGIQIFAPPLLKKTPSLDIVWNDNNHSKYEYTRIYGLEILPSGLFFDILYKFLHISTEIIFVWQNGIVGKIGEHSFNISLNQLERKINLSVRGDCDPVESFLLCTYTLSLFLSHGQHLIPYKETVYCPHCLEKKKN
eukprot:TRINITY_DN5991_c0_g1_i1.p2 TRINITY_DN5991_c0_g1~~TRINITY_DN5991_c0_g1_i1.p2  ORF type:complete len:664 (+),score=111.90 TRINITY_DN5991_c0_g1_i1:1104-3095(+)